ncbi:MAG: bifunctional folylpolyglutamate synthase/dihydrofolate synthase [Thermaerobacter sp.]|nr:bifunctional folylpolyglutamate synthase/dihydrofolate synthase [Thermaerobacter sp.]
MKQEWWTGQTRFGVRPGLDRIRALLDCLGHPEARYPIVHVAGTNGKGSVAAMTAAALKAQGWRTGLYVSPDLGRINERVWVDGAPLSERDWDMWAERIEAAGAGLTDMPTWFETVTTLAFLAFAESRVDIAVVEVGMGGRLDATNVIPPPMLSIITPVAYDHMRFLGTTIEAIAGEKAGILKAGTELVLARQSFSQARTVILDAAQKRGVPVFEASPRAVLTADGPELVTEAGQRVRTALLGAYQADNLDTAWTAIERLETHGWMTDLTAAAESLKTVQWPGRFQVLSTTPLIVVDGAHNPHGIAGVVNTLKSAPWNRRKWHVVFGVLGDKAWQEMLASISPYVQAMTVTRVPGERGSDTGVLAKHVRGIPIRIVDDPVLAVAQASRDLEDGDALLVTGSLALLAYLRQRGVFDGGVVPVVDS